MHRSAAPSGRSGVARRSSSSGALATSSRACGDLVGRRRGRRCSAGALAGARLDGRLRADQDRDCPGDLDLHADEPGLAPIRSRCHFAPRERQAIRRTGVEFVDRLLEEPPCAASPAGLVTMNAASVQQEQCGSPRPASRAAGWVPSPGFSLRVHRFALARVLSRRTWRCSARHLASTGDGSSGPNAITPWPLPSPGRRFATTVHQGTTAEPSTWRWGQP